MRPTKFFFQKSKARYIIQLHSVSYEVRDCRIGSHEVPAIAIRKRSLLITSPADTKLMPCPALY